MKGIIYLLNTYIFLIIALPQANAGGCCYEERKDIEKTFTVNKDVLLELTNKYGNVNIDTWDRNTINVLAEIIVNGKKEDDVKELLNRIDVRMEQGSNFVEIETIIEETQKKGWGWNWGNSNDLSYNIHYTVQMPKSGNVDIYNKYGNIDLDALNGYADIELKYGDLDTKDIGKDLELDLGYGNAEIGKVQNVDMYVKYSKIEIDACKQFDLESKYSSYNIGSVDLLDIDYCKYDKYKIKSVGILESDNKYTTFNIKYLAKSLDIESGYGKITIDEVSPNFKLIEIDSSYTPISLDIDDEAGAKVNIETVYGSIDFFESKSVSFKKEDHSKYLNGTLGNGRGEIIIESRYGSINIQ